MILRVDLEVVPEMCLPEEDAVAVLVGTAELLRVLVRLCVPRQLLLTSEALPTTLERQRTR